MGTNTEVTSRAIEFPIEGPACYFGIRFKLLAYQGFIATPIGEWNTPEHTIASDEIIPPFIVEQIAEALQNTVSLNERCAVVSSVLLAHLSLPMLDRRLERFAQSAMYADQVDINNFGVSARQLRRLSQLYLGLSIKDYLKVIRFQKTLHLMNTQGDDNAWLDHYYDQAHFSKEFKSLAGLPPKKFLNMSVLYNK